MPTLPTALRRLLPGAALAVLSFIMWTCSSDKTVGPPGAAVSLTFSTPPTNASAGTAITSVTVTALDANSHAATSFTGAITLAISSGTGVPGATLSGTTTLNAVGGAATFTGLNIDKTGAGYTLQASASGLTSATSGGFTITPGALSQLAFTIQPASTKAGATIAPSVQVAGQDALGNTVTSFTGAVTVTITPGTGAAGAILSGTAAGAAVSGVATFANLSIDKVGTASLGTGYTLSASATGATTATSNAFDIRSGTAVKLQFTVQPGASAAGAGFAPLVEVSALDSAGNVVTTFNGTVTIAIGTNPGGSTLGGTAAHAAVSGVATFPGLSLDKVGTGYTLGAAAAGLTAASSNAFDIAAASAAALAFSVPPGTTTDGAPITPAVRVSARDAFGNVATGFNGNVTLTIAQNPAAGTLSGLTTVAATAGVAVFSDLSIDNVGTGYKLAASVSGLSPDTSAAFDIIASTAAKLVFTVAPSGTIAGSTITPAIQVSARDASNQLVSSFTGMVTLAITGGTGAPGAALSGTAAIAAVAGVATFNNLSIDKSATGYTLSATAGGLQSAISAPFTITSGTATQLVFTVQPSSVQAAAVITPQVEVTARDALGNAAAGFTGNITIAIVTNPSAGVLSGTASVAAVAGVAVFTNLAIDKAGTGYTFGATASGPAAATSASFDVTAGAPTQLVFTTQPVTSVAGTSIAVQLTAKDGSNNTVTSFTGAVTVTITTGTGTAGATLSGTRTVSAVAGIANFTDLAIDRAGTGYTLSAIAVGLSGSVSSAFAITTGVASRLAFVVQPASTVAGVHVATVQLAAQDAQGNTVTSYIANVTVGIGSNPGGGTLSGTVTVAATAGVASFSTLSIDKSGAGYTLAASSGALTGVTSTSFDITAGTAAALAYTVQPSNVTAGSPIAPAILVSAKDLLGNTVTSFTGNVTVAIATNPAAGTLNGTATVPAVAGVASFSTLSINKAGAGYTLSASAGGLTSASSAAFTVAPGVATALAFTVQPSTTTTNANIAPAVKVTALDAGGNVASGFNGNVTVAIGTNPSSGTLAGTRTLAAVNGVASYQALAINNTGTGYTLTATATGLPLATSTAFNIIPSVATLLFFTVQPPNNDTAGTPLSPSIVVSARDASGQTAATFTGNVTLAITAGTGAPGAALSGTKTVAAVAGVATFSGLAIDKTAIYKLTATASGLTAATSSFFTINSGPATQLVFSLQPSTTTVATAITPSVEVSARDAQGNTAAGFTDTVTIAIATNPGTGVLSGTTKVAAVAGVASFGNLFLSQAGTGYTLSGSATGLPGTTSAAFNVSASRATQLSFSVQPASATAGATIAPAVKVTAHDASGNVATSFTGNVTLSITAGTGTAGATLAGTTAAAAVAGVATFSNLSVARSGSGYHLSAVGTAVSGATSAPFTISPAAATRMTFTVQPGSVASLAIIPGASAPAIQVTVGDSLGNRPILTYGGNVTIALLGNSTGAVLSGTSTVPASSGVATFNDLRIDKAGVYRLVVTAAGLTPDTSTSFSITAGAAASLQFTVQPTSVAAGAAITPAMRVTAFDAQGNLASNFTGNVTLAIATNPSAGVLGGTATVAAVNGVATFTGLSITPTGIGYTLQATASGLTQATSVAFNIN